MTRDGKDSSESVVRKKTVKDVGTDKDKVDIKLKKEKKSKNKSVFKCKNDKGEITVAHFSDNEEDEKRINDGNEGLTMFCNRCMKDVEKNDSCKACDDKLSSVRDKKKEIIKKYEIKPVSEWITITKNSIHSMTSKTIIAVDSSIVNQDVISVKDVAGIEDLEFLTDKGFEKLNVKKILLL